MNHARIQVAALVWALTLVVAYGLVVAAVVA